MYNQVYSTTDYNIFKPLDGNRGIKTLDQRHLKRLEESILEENLLEWRPIIVNRDMIVIDGHCRLEVAKNNNLPIYYMVAPEADHKSAMRLSRGTTLWTLKGYIQCNAQHGSEQFKKLAEFLEKNNISIHNLFRLYTNTYRNKHYIEKIKTGAFEYKEEMEVLVPYIKKINELIDVLSINGIKKWKLCQTEFWYGCYKFLTLFEDDLERFKEKLIKNIDMLSRKYGDWGAVASSLVRIYNLSRPKNRIEIDRLRIDT